MPLAILLFCFAMLSFVQIAAQDFQRLAAHAEAPQSAITLLFCKTSEAFSGLLTKMVSTVYDGRNFCWRVPHQC